MRPRPGSLLLRRALPLVAVVAVGCAGVAYVLRTPQGDAASSLDLTAQLVKAKPDDQATKDFLVSGSVDGLYPGGTRPLSLVLANPNSAAISVTSLTAAVGGVPGCPGSTLEVGPLGAPVVVPGRGSATATLPVHMGSGAAQACQGVRFILAYGGRAVKA